MVYDSVLCGFHSAIRFAVMYLYLHQMNTKLSEVYKIPKNIF